MNFVEKAAIITAFVILGFMTLARIVVSVGTRPVEITTQTDKGMITLECKWLLVKTLCREVGPWEDISK